MKKKYLLGIFAVALLAFMLASCVPQNQPLVVTFTNGIQSKSIAPGPVTFTWTVKDFNKNTTYTSVFTLTRDGKTVEGVTQEGNSAKVFLKENGHYVAKVVVTNSKKVKSEATEEFDVNSFNVMKYETNTGREYLIHYTAPSDIATPALIQFHFYYRTSSATKDGSIDHPRTRIYLTDEVNGVYTKWATADTFANQIPLTLPATIQGIYYSYFGESKFYGLLCENKSIEAVYADKYGYMTSVNVASVGFDMFKQYQVLLNTIDVNGKSSAYSWNDFILKERYDQDHYPTVFLTTKATSVKPGDTFAVYVKTKNLKEYFQNYLINCEYMQLPITYSASVTVQNVEFYNFMPNKEDLSAYSTGTSYLSLYKGFVNGTDESSAATDTIAKITFKVGPDFTSSSAAVSLSYEGNFANYGNYKDLPNPVFRDGNNAVIDGVVVNENPLKLQNK